MMTSKEALEQLRDKAQLLALIEGEKAYQFLDLIDNLYNTIKQDLERLEAINKVWHDNEPMESVDINANHLQELYNYINKLQQNEKLKKAIKNEIELLRERRFNAYACDNYVHNIICGL